MPRNYMDFVLLKSDGIPTYHFAHVVDDHLMQTTYIIRGEEWLPSLPMHVELFHALKWPEPIYCHTATLMKMDGASKRKLSKRHDPELALAYYKQEGVVQDAVWSYLLTILNSNFEQWQTDHPTTSYREFQFSIDNMSNSGALIDLAKLNDISKDVISNMSAEDVYSKWLDWCQKYRPDMAELIRKYLTKTLKALQIGRGGKNRRKDLYNWKQTCDFMSFYFDETFTIEDSMPQNVDKDTQAVFFARYLAQYDHNADAQNWFAGVKALSSSLGFALKHKDYKKSPELYKGSIIHTTNMLRIALTGRANAPDIWEISQVLGEETVRYRIGRYL